MMEMFEWFNEFHAAVNSAPLRPQLQNLLTVVARVQIFKKCLKKNSTNLKLF